VRNCYIHIYTYIDWSVVDATSHAQGGCVAIGRWAGGSMLLITRQSIEAEIDDADDGCL
jgi:hypothetical protein